jgi:hypothetical protein
MKTREMRALVNRTHFIFFLFSFYTIPTPTLQVCNTEYSANKVVKSEYRQS